MGVIQKILPIAEIEKRRGGFVEFELNEGGIIHIQNDIWRIEMSIPEFAEFAVCCSEAAFNIRKIKGLDQPDE